MQIIVSLIISALMVLGGVAYTNEIKTPSVGASQSISSLTELTTLSHNDVFPITEANGLTTKKVKWGTATSTLKVINDALYSPLIGSASITTLGTITTGTWNADTLTVAKGGTGSTSLIAYQLLAGNGTGAVTTFGNGTSGYVLTSNGAGALPSFQNVGVTTGNNNTWTGTNTFTATTTFSGDTVGSISGLYGDGSDGNVTMTSGTTTLTRDMYYNNLTVNAGATTSPNGFRVFVKNTLTVNGGIVGDGNNGTDGTNVASCSFGACPSSASVAGAGGTSTNSYLGRAPYGGNGGNGGGISCNGADGTAGTAGTLTSYLSFTLNSGGTGGNGGAGAQTGGCSYTPAVGAGSTSPSIVYFKINNLLSALNPFGISTHTISAGASGGGGGGSGSSCNGCSGGALNVGGAGGGAGANGSPIQIFARTVIISSNGVISSRGGSGGKGGNGGSVSGGTTNLGGGGGGGGAGGSGGWIQIITSSYSNLGSLSVSGGTGGQKGTGGTGGTGNGSDGTDGVVGSSGVSAIIIQ